MIIAITCTECGKDGRFPFKLAWEYDTEHCLECHNTETKEMDYHFCSEVCMKKFVNRFVNHKHNYRPTKFSDSQYSMLINKRNEDVAIRERCKICNMVRWRTIRGKEKEKHKKQIDRMMAQ